MCSPQVSSMATDASRMRLLHTEAFDLIAQGLKAVRQTSLGPVRSLHSKLIGDAYRTGRIRVWRPTSTLKVCPSWMTRSHWASMRRGDTLTQSSMQIYLGSLFVSILRPIHVQHSKAGRLCAAKR